MIELTTFRTCKVYGNGVSFSNAHNSIVRYIRFRMGKGGDSGKDGIALADGDNMIFDHISTSWGRDETFSINGACWDWCWKFFVQRTPGPVYNVTISDSIIAQGLETHSCGGLMQTDGGVSIFRTLYIDNKTRNPKVKGINDFTNNVVYNWVRIKASNRSFINRLLGWRRRVHCRRLRWPVCS